MKRNEYVGALCAALMGWGSGIGLLLVGALTALRMANPQGMLTAIAYVAPTPSSSITYVLNVQGSNLGKALLAQ